MPLPRYKPSEVRNIAAGSRAIASQAQASMYGTLSDKLNQWSGNLYQIGAEQRKREGVEKAIDDVAKGKFEQVGDFSVYDKAYKDAARTAYTVNGEQEAKQYANFLREKLNTNPDTRDNPDAFLNSYDAYSKEVIKEAPDEYLKGVLSQSLKKYGTEQYTNILNARNEKIEKYQKESYTNGIKLYQEEYKEAILSGDTESINSATEKLTSLYNSGISNMYVTENEAKFDLMKIKKDTFVELSMKNFKESSNRVEYLTKFRENKTLNAKETDEAIDNMHKMMKSEIEDRDIIAKAEEESHAKFVENVNRGIYKKLASRTLTEKDLMDALRLKAITTSEYDDFNSRMKSPDLNKDGDDESYDWYLKNMSNVTEKQIIDDPSLTTTQQDKLLSRKEQLLKMSDEEAKEMGDWEGSSQGKQAIREIQGHFKIFAGTIMSKADINNLNTRDYNLIRASYYDNINLLPIEQRIPKSLEIARKMLTDYEKGEIIGTKPYEEKVSNEATIEQELQNDLDYFIKEQDKVKGSNAFIKFLRNF